MDEQEIAKTVLECMQEAVYVRDLQMGLLYINPAAERLTGWTLEGARARKCYEIFGDADCRCREVCPAEKTIAEALPLTHHEGELKSRDGRVYRMRVSISPFYQEGVVMGATVVMQDLTELKNLEKTHVKTLIQLEKEVQKRRESEVRLRSLINALPDAISFKDGQGRWLEANASNLCLFGLEGVAYQGKTDRELAEHSPFYRPALLACESSDEAAWQKGALSRCQERIPAPDGSEQIFEVIKVPTFHPEGSRHGLVVIGRDVSEQRRAKAQLQRKFEEQRLLLDTIDAQVWYLSDIETYGLANRAHAEFLGLDLEQIAYQKLESFVSPQVAEVCKTSNLQVFQTGQPVFTEEWVPNAKGEPRLLQIVKMPKINDRGQVEYVVCTGTDITDLRATEMRFRTLFDNAPLGIEVFDAHGRLTLINRACLEIFGVDDPESVIGFNLFADPQAPAGLRAGLERGETLKHEFRYDFETLREHPLYPSRRRGAIDIFFLITPLQSQHILAPSGYMAIIEEITDRKQAEAERLALERRVQQAEKAESLARMAGAVAHNFNNMLAAVLGNMEMLADLIGPGTDSAEFLHEAQKAAFRASKLSRRMLTFLGHAVTQPESLDLCRFCRQELDQLGLQLPEGIRLETEIPEPGPIIQADPALLRQVLAALITNAWEAQDGKDGWVKVSVETVGAADMPAAPCFPTTWQASAERYAGLGVADSGQGIPPERLSCIFDPFFSDKFTGRGMGLAMVLGIVKAHQGCIAVESSPGQGSCFRVFFPLAEGEREAIIAPDSDNLV